MSNTNRLKLKGVGCCFPFFLMYGPVGCNESRQADDGSCTILHCCCMPACALRRGWSRQMYVPAMEFLKRIGIIPTVKASDTDGSKNETKQSEPTKEKKKMNPYADVIAEEECGYNLYPERKGDYYVPTLWNKIWRFEGREEFDRVRCEKKLYTIMKGAPLIKLMFGALKNAGCDVDYRRNFSCEVCAPGVQGGYDRFTQQIVICQNNVKLQDLILSVLGHEMIHMYDHCVNKTDFRNVEHLACSEIRAANITGCSILGAFLSGHLSIFQFLFMQYGKKHAECVKGRAFMSVKAARSISDEAAYEVIEKVFPHCYNDMEPIGRRLRSGSEDAYRAYLEGHYYGYV